MLFEIIRQYPLCFGEYSTEQWMKPTDFDNVNHVIDELKTNNLNAYEFEDVNDLENTANFIITNRSRYDGDIFYIQPFIDMK